MTKSVVWRILGIIILATITYIFTGNWIQTGLITFIHHASFLIIYYLHERGWLKIKVKFRHILKAITYEIILGNLVLGTITWLITGDWKKVAGITLIYISIKLIIYPIYDFFWTKTKIVYAYIVGDIIHIGHLKHLEKAKKHGDYLIVGVLTDKAVMEKKPKPIISFTERIETTKAIKLVDEAIPQETYSPLENIKRIKPDVLMESTDHKEQPANDFVKSYGGEVVITSYYKLQSSTKIKNEIIKRQN